MAAAGGADSAATVDSAVAEATLRELIASRFVKQPIVIGQPGGFTVVVVYGNSRGTLTSASGKPRLFASLNTVAKFLQRLGASGFRVITAGYTPGRLRPPRPDRARALRQQTTAAKKKGAR